MQLQKIDIRQPFGLNDITQAVFLNGNTEPVPGTPIGNPDYVWDRGLIQDMVTFFMSGEISMQCIGHTGTGKSSFCEEFHNRLNLPLYVLNANPRTESSQLVGAYAPCESGAWAYKYGVVGRAALEGRSCLIDEYNVIDPGECTGLNDLLEGRPVFIPETGEWLKPKEGFRIFTTINPKTIGYVGRNTQDVANDDRFQYMWFDYMPEANEIALIKTALLKAGMKDVQSAERTARCFREVADAVRKAYMGSSDDPGALDVTVSTRSLLRWAKMTLRSAGVAVKNYSPVHYALERAKTFKASPESRLAIHAMVTQIFGDEYKTPLNPAASI